MAKITRIIGNVWDSLCDHSDFVEHMDSVIRWKYIRPGQETIRDFKEAQKAKEYSDGAF